MAAQPTRGIGEVTYPVPGMRAFGATNSGAFSVFWPIRRSRRARYTTAMKNVMSDLIRVSVLAIATVPLLALRRHDVPRRESFEWVAGEILPGDAGWAPRVGALLRDAPRA